MIRNRIHFAGPKMYLAFDGWLRAVLLPYGLSSVRLRLSEPTARLLSRNADSE